MCYIAGYIDSSLVDDLFLCLNRIKNKNFTIICNSSLSNFTLCRLGFVFNEELTLSQVRDLLYGFYPCKLYLRKFLSFQRLKLFLKVGV